MQEAISAARLNRLGNSSLSVMEKRKEADPAYVKACVRCTVVLSG
jgi:hypothetical protein